MENNNLCKLCYNSDKQIINIFDENGIELNIARILKKHFWFKIIENDYVSNVICTDCWWKTENFHKFYNDVKNTHNNYINISYKTNKLFHFKTKLIVGEIGIESPNKFNDDLKLVKVENVNVYETSCDTITIETPTYGITADVNDEKQDLNTNLTNSFKENNLNDNNFEDAYESNDDEINISKRSKSKTNKFNLTKTSKIVKTQNNVVKQVTISTTDINIEKKCEVNPNVLEKKIQIDKEDAQIREYFKMDCEICNYEFKTFLEGKAHYREQHKVKGFIKCCKRKFFRRGVALEHIIQHINPEAYKCHFCNRIYSNKIALRNHIRDYHSSSGDKPYKCNICHKSYFKKCHLTQHVKYRHYTEEDKIYACDICGKSYLTKCHLIAHIRGVHENAFVQMCDLCARVFKSKAVLERHRQSHFGTDTIQKLQCNICGRWLKCKDSLRAHLSRHKDILKHNCSQCGKEYANRNALNKHIRCVHSGKTHICNICKKEFKQPIGLKEHMASHTGEVLYTCPYCPKTFNSGANMHSHRKKMHPVEWLENKAQHTKKGKNETYL